MKAHFCGEVIMEFEDVKEEVGGQGIVSGKEARAETVVDTVDEVLGGNS